MFGAQMFWQVVLAIAQAIGGNAWGEMVQIVIGDVAGADVPPMAQLKGAGPLKRGFLKLVVGFAIPVGIFKIVFYPASESITTGLR